jgi:hypothetical protein
VGSDSYLWSIARLEEQRGSSIWTLRSLCSNMRCSTANGEAEHSEFGFRSDKSRFKG